jgi:hypothetical protein
MKYLLLLAFFFFQKVDIPYKSSDEFKVEIDLKFKSKPPNESTLNSEFKLDSYSNNGTRKEYDGRPESFLIVKLSQIKILNDEVKMLASNSKGKMLFKRKCSPEDVRIEMGFLSDLKSGVTSNEVTIFFLSAEKKELRKIVLTVLPDGTFQVNGNWHGKF